MVALGLKQLQPITRLHLTPLPGPRTQAGLRRFAIDRQRENRCVDSSCCCYGNRPNKRWLCERISKFTHAATVPERAVNVGLIRMHGTYRVLVANVITVPPKTIVLLYLQDVFPLSDKLWLTMPDKYLHVRYRLAFGSALRWIKTEPHKNRMPQQSHT